MIGHVTRWINCKDSTTVNVQLLNTPLLPTLHFAKVTQWVGNAGDELWKTTRLTRIGAALFCCFPRKYSDTYQVGLYMDHCSEQKGTLDTLPTVA